MTFIYKNEEYMVKKIINKLIFQKIPQYKKNQNCILNFGFFLVFSIALSLTFSYLSYHFLFYTFLLISAILVILTFYFYRKFCFSQNRYDVLYSYFYEIAQDILIIEHENKNLSESMIYWFFINKEKMDGEIYAPILLDSMKYDINHMDCYGNTLLHYIISNDDTSNQNKIYISHALLIGADLDIKNDKSITARFLLSQKYPEYLATIEQLEIIKSFKE